MFAEGFKKGHAYYDPSSECKHDVRQFICKSQAGWRENLQHIRLCDLSRSGLKFTDCETLSFFYLCAHVGPRVKVRRMMGEHEGGAHQQKQVPQGCTQRNTKIQFFVQTERTKYPTE